MSKLCKSIKSSTDINNYECPFYRVVLEDGPTRDYNKSSVFKYIAPKDMHLFYDILPQLARYYKVTISIVENPHAIPF